MSVPDGTARHQTQLLSQSQNRQAFPLCDVSGNGGGSRLASGRESSLKLKNEGRNSPKFCFASGIWLVGCFSCLPSKCVADGGAVHRPCYQACIRHDKEVGQEAGRPEWQKDQEAG